MRSARPGQRNRKKGEHATENPCPQRTDAPPSSLSKGGRASFTKEERVEFFLEEELHDIGEKLFCRGGIQGVGDGSWKREALTASEGRVTSSRKRFAGNIRRK